MSEGKGPMMLPTSVHLASATNSHISHLSSHRNTPEEDDETMSTELRDASILSKPESSSDLLDRHLLPDHNGSLFSRQSPDTEQEHKHIRALPQSSFCSSQPPHSLPAGYSPPTPFPSQAYGSWLHPSFASSWSGYPNSLPSCLSQKDNSSCSGESCLSRYKFLSLPSTQSTSLGSLEQPLSLRSNPPSANLYHHTLSPYSCAPQGLGCCAQCPADTFSRGAAGNKHPWPEFHPANGPFPAGGFTQIDHNAPAKEKWPPCSAPLSLEQRRVFVTYEADNDKHVNEIINFVALLRHNGFDTHIDIFEQQFRSISKIDFMERYLSEKEYLIIIIISPKYYETVTASPVGLENDERTFNTVYIHKQLQNEFIQNGSKNFRFIPILFPGAKKCHVPNWLQNTHVYGWPRDRDDILRRLMRVEKYNPPPIGELPTIVSIPI
ncbi:adapter protein CIKS [Archocentrus centrarchus]|uniref:adapter protein CIKS n=1 Tax=Archocentrus centrarchus TaxID=63155 RepID=UPI0011E9D9A8|nr:adapter protein CIKS-like [Archocentrus centrarchus]